MMHVMRRKFWIVLVVALGIGYGAWAQFGVLLGFEEEGAYFTARDGTRLHYVEAGAGEPIILVHGFAMNIDLSWRRPGVIDTLAKEYRVVAYDARGHGRSGRPAGALAYGEAMIDDIVDLMEHVGIPRAHLVGQSMGGMTVLKFVAEHPERVISASANAMGWAQPTPQNLGTIDALARSLESGNGLRPLLERLAPTDGSMGQFTKATLDTLVGFMNDTEAMMACARGLPELCVTESQLRANRVPVLTIIGGNDPLVREARDLHQTMGYHQLTVVPGADHFYVTATAEFHATLMNFLRMNREMAVGAVGVGT